MSLNIDTVDNVNLRQFIEKSRKIKNLKKLRKIG